MKISVLIAAPSSAPGLADSLASVRQQTHVDWELFIVQYGAPPPGPLRGDAGKWGAQLNGHPVTHLNLGANHGVVSARNRLLELATTDWVAFLDPSDIWSPQHLTGAVQLPLTSADVVASDVRVQRPHAPDSHIAFPSQLEQNPTRTLFVGDPLSCISAVTFRRRLAEQVGFFDPRFDSGEARDFWLRCALHGARFRGTHRPTCYTRRTAEIDPGHMHRIAAQRVQFYEKHRSLPAIPAALRRNLLSASLVARGRLLQPTNPTDATRHFLRAWTLQPLHVQTLGQLALLGPRESDDASGEGGAKKRHSFVASSRRGDESAAAGSTGRM